MSKSGKSGGSNGGIGIQVVDELPENPDENVLYKYTGDVLGSMLMLYDGTWKYIPLCTYPNERLITPAEIYQIGGVYNSTPLDAIYVIELEESVQIDKFSSASALKIHGKGNDNITYGWRWDLNIPENITLGRQYLYIGKSSEGGYDYAKVSVNGTETDYKSSDTYKTFKIPITLNNGSNEIIVKYTKDGSSSGGDDCVYVYGIKYSYT